MAEYASVEPAFLGRPMRDAGARENLRRLGTWGWRDLAVIPPDDDASRWFRADFQRSRVAARCAQQAGL